MHIIDIIQAISICTEASHLLIALTEYIIL